MIFVAITIIALLFLLWGMIAVWQVFASGISLHQALLYAPLKILFRVKDAETAIARKSDAPVIYAIWHSSRLEPALMLSLLPDQTLHILDPDSAKAWWLDPWRLVARTIVFNARHVFVSRRLVRRLRAGGRLAVYLPDNTSPGQKAFRLFRAISRIAVSSGAYIVPIYVDGADHSLFALDPEKRKHPLPKLTIKTLEPKTIAELVEMDAAEKSLAANVMFDRLLSVRNPS